MLFHFEYRCNGRWEAIGSGEGRGEEDCAAALADLNALAGGSLPAGTYRCIAAISAATRWESLRLAPSGEVVFEDGPPSAAPSPPPAQSEGAGSSRSRPERIRSSIAFDSSRSTRPPENSRTG